MNDWKNRLASKHRAATKYWDKTREEQAEIRAEKRALIKKCEESDNPEEAAEDTIKLMDLGE